MVSIDNLPAGYNIFLVRSGPMDVRRRNVEILSSLTEIGYKVVIVTSDIPSTIQIEEYDEAGIDTGMLYFIDMVTAYAMGKRQENTDQVFFTERPGDLTKAGIIITNIVKENEGEKLAFLFDTINTLLIYSNQLTITRFIHFVINKLRLNRVKGFFITVEKSLQPELLSDFEMMADVSIPRDEAITLLKSKIGEGISNVPDEESFGNL